MSFLVNTYSTILTIFEKVVRSMLAQVISTIYEDTITLRPKAQWQREKDPAALTNKLGYIFFAPNKESLDKGVALRTYFTLDQKLTEAVEQLEAERYEAPFITMNSFAIRKKQQRYLRWINAISIEIDNLEATMADVIHLCQMFDLPYPNLAVKSPNGIHIHWLIERERSNAQMLHAYEVISSAFKKVFEWIGADAVGPERYWRMPTSYNVIYQHDDRYSVQELKAWAVETLDIKEQLQPIHHKKSEAIRLVKSDVMENPAIQRLLQGVPSGVRNRTAFTLALLLYRTQHMSENEIYTYLLNEWNVKNEVRIKRNELRKSVKSACSGRYHNASAKHINEILETIGSDLRFRYKVRSKYVGQKTYVKRSTLAQRILDYVNENGGSICVSQRAMAKSLDAAFKSVQNAILEIKERELAEVSSKVGRGGGTVITLLPRDVSTEGKEEERLKAEEIHNNSSEPGQVTELESQQAYTGERLNIVPLPSTNPIDRVRNTVASYSARRATIEEICQASKLDYHVFFQILMRLISEREIEMREPAKDRTARFVLAKEVPTPDG